MRFDRLKIEMRGVRIVVGDKPGPTRESVVSLREVTRDSVVAICRLQVAEGQRQFVATNAISIAQAHFEGEKAWFRGIYADETPVGFVMLYEDSEKPEYYLWRFMIDERFQKLGFGAKALELILAHVRTVPGAKEISLSYHKGDGGPDSFYRKFGFRDTGEKLDDEHVMKLTF